MGTSEHLTLALQDFLLTGRAKQLSPKTIEFYEWNLSKFIAWLHDRTLDAKAVRSYFVWQVDRGVKPDASARSIKAWCRFMLKEGYLEVPILFDMPRRIEPIRPVLSPEQVSKLISVCKKPRDLALVLLMVDSGMRRQEISDLTWDDIDLTSGVVLVRSGKGNKRRVTMIGIRTRKALLRWKAKQGSNVDFSKWGVFNLRGMGIRQVLRRLGDRAGFPVGCHQLRRTAATLYIANGGPISSLQMMLGHSQITTTALYVRSSQADLEAHHSQFGAVDRLR